MVKFTEKKLIRFDWAIKYILRDKANFVILEGFLSELLGEIITITKILESESNQSKKKDKFNRVDILVENSTGELLITHLTQKMLSSRFMLINPSNDFFNPNIYILLFRAKWFNLDLIFIISNLYTE